MQVSRPARTTTTAWHQQQEQQQHLQRQQLLRQLAYLYVILLLLEGAIRKWMLPPLAGPLLLVRDPIALAILWISWRQGLWQGERWLRLWIALAVLMLATGLLAQLADGVQPLDILLFGLRTALLHLPLILLLPRILNAGDVLRLGRWLIAIALPIALLMVVQYKSPASAWVNRTAFAGGSLLTAVEGKVRPPGPFSFITGAAQYFSLVNAYLLTGLINQTVRPALLGLGFAATMIAASVSGSRLLIGSCQVVWVLGIAAVLLWRPDRLSGRALITFGVAGLIGLAVLLANPYSRTVAEGQRTTEARQSQANRQDGGLRQRGLQMFTIPEQVWASTPPFGLGLGLGSNYGSQRIAGKAGFLLQENEWPRVVQESGPFTGSLFILFRIGLALHVGRLALAALRHGSVLPVALFAAGFHLLVIGPISQPTTLGFAVVVMGLALTAAYSVLLPATAPAPAPPLQQPSER